MSQCRIPIMKRFQSIYDNLNKQDASAYDKALWRLISAEHQRKRIFDELKAYRVDKLKLCIDVMEEKNKFEIKARIVDRHADADESNPIVPVSVFFRSLKYSLNRQKISNMKEIFGKLCHYFGRGCEKSVIFRFLRDRIAIVDNIFMDYAYFTFFLEDYILSFICMYWNERTEAVYERVFKTHRILGEEDDKIKEFNEKLEKIYVSRTSFRQFKALITEVVMGCFKIPDTECSNEKLNVIVSDAMEVLRIWLKLFEQSENEILSGYTQREEYAAWKEKYLTKKQFGTRLIEAQKRGEVEEERWKRQWEEYALQHPGEYSRECLSFSVLDQRELYSNENIEKILSKKLKDKLINVYIAEYNIDDGLNKQYMEKIKKEQQIGLIYKLKLDLEEFQSSQITEKICVFGFKSNINKITTASIVRCFRQDAEVIITVIPLIEYGYSHHIHGLLNKDTMLSNYVDGICAPQECEPLTSIKELDISKFVEVTGLAIQNIGIQVQKQIDSILGMETGSLETNHLAIVKGESSDKNEESGQDDCKDSLEMQAEASGTLKRKRTECDLSGVTFNMDISEQQGDNMGHHSSSCPPPFPCKKRGKYLEDETKDIFPFEPLEENVAESYKVSARLYSQIAYLVALKYPEPTNPNINPDNVLAYVANVGDIISGRQINLSLRVYELLQAHYQEAQDFCNTYPKDTMLDLVEAEVDSSSLAWLFDNGKYSLLVSYDGNRYQIYSTDLNYRQSFQTKEGVSFTDVEIFAEKFFQLRDNSIEYDLFTLKQNLPQTVVDKINQAKFWSPDQVLSVCSEDLSQI